MEIQPCAPHPEPEVSPQLAWYRALCGPQDSPVTCRIAVQPSSRRARLATATILLASGKCPLQELGGVTKSLRDRGCCLHTGVPTRPATA